MNERENSKKKIMLADDDPFIIELYQSKLIREGFDVVPVTNGEETLSELDRCCPDMLVLDLNMPRLDGLEVLGYIRSNSQHSDLPVIVLSNACTEKMLSALWKLEPTAVLTKRDTVPNKVIEEIRKAFARRGTEAERSAPSAEPRQAESAASMETTAIEDALQKFFDSADDDARKDALLDLYKILQDNIKELQEGDPRTYAAQFGKAMEGLFEDLYASPDCINPCMCRTLAQVKDALPSALAMAEGVTAPAAKSCLTLLFIDDHEMRNKMADWLDRPGYTVVQTSDESVAHNLMATNRFCLAILDAFSVGAAEKNKKFYTAEKANEPNYTLFLMNPGHLKKLKDGFLDSRTDIAARPPLQSEIILKAAMANIIRIP